MRVKYKNRSYTVRPLGGSSWRVSLEEAEEELGTKIGVLSPVQVRENSWTWVLVQGI